MSYIDWRHLPRRERVLPPPLASTRTILLACGAGLVPFVLLAMLATFATNTVAPVTTGTVILGP